MPILTKLDSELELNVVEFLIEVTINGQEKGMWCSRSESGRTAGVAHNRAYPVAGAKV